MLKKTRINKGKGLGGGVRGAGLATKASVACLPEVCRKQTVDLTEAEPLFYFLFCSVLIEP